MLLLILTGWSVNLANAGEAHVVWTDPTCPTFVAKLDGDYGVYQTRSGTRPDEGDALLGEVTGEGIVSLENKTKGAPMTAILIATSESMKALVYSMATIACQRRFR